MAIEICPACGGEGTLIETLNERGYTPPFGSLHKYTVPMKLCTACHEGFERDDSADIVWAEIAKADRLTVCPMLDYIAPIVGSPVHVEAVLRIPLGSIARWRAGDITPAELALLRLIRAQPDLVKLARDGYRGT